MNNENYQSHKTKYLGNFSKKITDKINQLESKENWTIDTEIGEVRDLFDRLPSLCKHPIEAKFLPIVSNLIKIIAYLPFKDSVCTLSWLGTENEQWGYAIYLFADEIYSEQAQDDNDLFLASKTLIERVLFMAKLGTIQVVIGDEL